LRTSSSRPIAPASSVQLCKRTRSGCRRTIFPDLIGGMRSMTLCLGILAANTRRLLLSPSESRLNSQVVVLRSSSSSGFMAPLMILFEKPSVRYLPCFSTAFSSESDKPGSMYCFLDPAPSELSESSESRNGRGDGNRYGHPGSRLPNRRRPQYAAKKRKACHRYRNR
jgi:hypothetical protein